MQKIHPRLNENGEQVLIKNPSSPTSSNTWEDPGVVATFVPDGPVPEHLNGIPLLPWTDHPRTAEGWNYVEGLNPDLEETPLNTNSKKAAAGVVVLEQDGRVWVIHPTNQYAGYSVTWPKGRVEPGISMQATAVREVWEEAGLQVRITDLLGDFQRSTTTTRLYLGERVGGSPAFMGWEAQAASLVPPNELDALLNRPADVPVIEALRKRLDLPKTDHAGEIILGGGNLVRALQALDGFMAAHGSWPTRLRVTPICLADLALRHLTPLGFFKLQSKIRLEIGDELNLVALSDDRHCYDYSKRGFDLLNTGMSAREWLGI